MNSNGTGEVQKGEEAEPRPTEPAFPTTLSDIVFRSSLDSALETNIYKVLSTLRKSTLSIPNRLLSVLQDAEFIEALHNYLDRHRFLDSGLISAAVQQATQAGGSPDEIKRSHWPVIPNERSGSWPLPPQLKIDSQGPFLSSIQEQNPPSPVSAYFKSTDGHVNQWAFSTRRLNLPVLNLLGAAGRVVLVDTTRRGKAYPDALRRTVPIFTSVWNHLIFGDLILSGVCAFQGFGLEDGEVSQIEKRIPGFVRDLKGLGLDFEELKRNIKKPIRCLWISQPSQKQEWTESFQTLIEQIELEQTRWKNIGGVNVLICCSASRRVIGTEMSDEGYIQGAGDDSEGWSHGLTAKLFWEHHKQLMELVRSGGDVDGQVKDIVRNDKLRSSNADAVLVKPTRNLFVGVGSAGAGAFDLLINCNVMSNEEMANTLHLGCKEGKIGSKMLREQLSLVTERIRRLFLQRADANVLVVCSTGKDLSVGVILTILCSFYDDRGSVQLESSRLCDKQFIKQRLAWMTSSKPDANPSRATLQSVNSFLIDRPD